jgi:hypothetical protein
MKPILLYNKLFVQIVAFDKLTNGTTNYATSFTDKDVKGTSLKCSIKCPIGLECSGWDTIFSIT